MNFLISGSTGFLGSALVQFLIQNGHDVTGLVRRPRGSAPTEIVWDPTVGILDKEQLEGFDVVVHLAGENIAQKRWTPQYKMALRDSRIVTTTFLSETLASLKNPPHTLISSSATGYYGNRGNELMTEQSDVGTGFLATLCQAWEAATQPAQEAGIRVVHARSGMVLSAQAGALKKILPPFKLGLGATLGSGKQYMSWISINDWVRAMDFVINTLSLKGPVNLVGPHPVTNKEFTHELASAVGTKAFLKAPEFLLRIVFGDLADEAMLISQRVIPAKLNEAGFKFQQEDLRKTLQDMLTSISD